MSDGMKIPAEIHYIHRADDIATPADLGVLTVSGGGPAVSCPTCTVPPGATRVDDLRCPSCGRLADDIDDEEAWCPCGRRWATDPSETYLPDLLAAVREGEAEIAQLRARVDALTDAGDLLAASCAPDTGTEPLPAAVTWWAVREVNQ